MRSLGLAASPCSKATSKQGEPLGRHRKHITVRRQTAASRQRQCGSRGQVTITCATKSGSDFTMVWGDAVMLTATELASDRIPVGEAGLLSGIMLASWVSMAVMKGDYRTDKEGTIFIQVFLINAMMASMMTWVMAVPVALAVYSFLAPGQIVDSGVLTLPGGAPFNALPPQLEVMMADLVTLACWRGIYAYFRL